MDEPSNRQVDQKLSIEKSTVSESLIGGQAGRDLTQNQGSGNLFKDVTFNVFQSATAASPASPEDYRNRQILLNKVRNYWINEALERSLDRRLQLTIPLEERAEAIANPWVGMVGGEGEATESLAPEITVSRLFDQLGEGRTLLILGAPGAGKTIALLQLARFLVNQVEQGLYNLVPVVLNLSAWQSPRQTLAEWIQAELHTKYQVPQKVGQAWIQNDQLCLLLDGLDEVEPTLRAACVEAINAYHADHAPDMVVCCREQDYAELPNRLNFQAAICLKPLTLDQIDQNLQALPAAAGLRHLLREDKTLQELAHSPLMLNLIVQSYQGVELPALAPTEALAERRRQVLMTYVQQMLNRRSQSMVLPRSLTLVYLHRLAQYLQQTSQSIFLIELMQPTWLTAPRDRWLYQSLAKIIPAMVWGSIHAGLLAGHELETRAFVFSRGALGFLFGLVSGLAYGLIAGCLSHILTQKTPSWIGRLINGLLMGSLFAPVFGWIYYNRDDAIAHAIAYFVVYSLIGIWIYDPLFRQTIEPAESVRWSRRRLGINALFGIVIGLALYFGTHNKLPESLVFGLMGGLIFFGFEKQSQVERTSFPNQGIWRSLQNSLRFFVIIGGVTGLLLGIWQEPVSGVVNGIILGTGAALVGGQGSGIVCTKHFVLRVMLWAKRYIPWNYEQFLEWGCDLNLLQRIGGGYGFIHRLLLEHLADLPIAEAKLHNTRAE